MRVGAGDDCAVVAGDGIAVSTDLSVEGVHFRRDWISLREAGYRAAAAALSDLAAVAARPIGVLVSLALPPEDAGAPATRLMEGVAEAAGAVGAALLGGDVARTEGPLVVDVTVLGEATAPVLRAGARPGDELWVTGELGGAAAAVVAWGEGGTPPLDAYRRFAAPAPRVAEARWLAERGLAAAMIDLSDGLAGDVAHLATAAGLGVAIEAAAVPLHPALERVATGPELALRLALAGGEDYELCFAARAGGVEPQVDAFHAAFGLRLTRVGRFIEEEGVYVQSPTGERRPLRLGGFQHFQEPA